MTARAYDMSEHQRIYTVESDNITGLFTALGNKPDRNIWISTLDATIWFNNRQWGRVYYSNDLKASVKDGEVDLPKHMISSDLLAEVEDVWDEMCEVIAAVAAKHLEAVQ